MPAGIRRRHRRSASLDHALPTLSSSSSDEDDNSLIRQHNTIKKTKKLRSASTADDATRDHRRKQAAVSRAIRRNANASYENTITVTVLVMCMIASASVYLYFDVVHFSTVYIIAHYHNHPKAQTMVASHYLLGKGVEQDHREAEVWLRKAAENGQAHAMYNLGVLHGQRRPEINITDNEAKDFLHQSAKKGLPEAQVVVGDMYRSGIGVNVDHAKAHHWYQKAIEKNHPEGFERLSYMHEHGIGVPKNSELAEYYASMAKEHHKKKHDDFLAEEEGWFNGIV